MGKSAAKTEHEPQGRDEPSRGLAPDISQPTTLATTQPEIERKECDAVRKIGSLLVGIDPDAIVLSDIASAFLEPEPREVQTTKSVDSDAPTVGDAKLRADSEAEHVESEVFTGEKNEKGLLGRFMSRLGFGRSSETAETPGQEGEQTVKQSKTLFQRALEFLKPKKHDEEKVEPKEEEIEPSSIWDKVGTVVGILRDALGPLWGSVGKAIDGALKAHANYMKKKKARALANNDEESQHHETMDYDLVDELCDQFHHACGLDFHKQQSEGGGSSVDQSTLRMRKYLEEMVAALNEFGRRVAEENESEEEEIQIEIERAWERVDEQVARIRALDPSIADSPYLAQYEDIRFRNPDSIPTVYVLALARAMERTHEKLQPAMAA